MKKLTLFLFLLLSLSTFAQTNVSVYKPGVTENGITYFLPRTKLLFTITIKKEHFTPGDFFQYAQRYLRLSDVTQYEYDQWNISNISMQTFGVADSSKIYSIEFKKKTVAPLVSLAKDGRLLSINCKASEVPEVPIFPTPKVIKSEENAINPRDYMTQEILMAGSKAKMAELVASEIYDIRENRNLLAKGQADFMPSDGTQLKLMLSKLDQQESALLQLFKGKKEEETHILTIVYDPTKNTQKEILFRFSKYFGLVDKDDLSGEPYYLNIRNLLNNKNSNAANINESKKEEEEKDVRYNIPGETTIWLLQGTKQILKGTYPIAQFGEVEHLGGDLFNKKYTTSITFYPSTGGTKDIKKVE